MLGSADVGAAGGSGASRRTEEEERAVQAWTRDSGGLSLTRVLLRGSGLDPSPTTGLGAQIHKVVTGLANRRPFLDSSHMHTSEAPQNICHLVTIEGG